MHEMGLVFAVVETVEKVAIENECTHVSKIVLQIGEISNVVPKYVEECFPAALFERGPLFEDCKLEIELMPAMVMCNHCNKIFNVVEHDRVCPFCETDADYEIVSGEEFDIKEIEAV